MLEHTNVAKIVPLPGEWQDILGGDCRFEAPVLDYGFVALVDAMPRRVPVGRTGDYAVVQAARVSYGEGTTSLRDDRQLIRYLYRRRHTSPFEMVELKWHCKMPIFVARQLIRHRTASVNEVSARYSELPEEFWLAAKDTTGPWRGQGTTNKQGSDGAVDYACGVWTIDNDPKNYNAEEVAFEEYHRRIKAGVSKEMARSCLPVSTYTSWYWKIDLHNLLHFLSLRLDEHAQKEARDYAWAMYHILQALFPHSCEAFNDYHPAMGGMSLSRAEVEHIAAREWSQQVTITYLRTKVKDLSGVDYLSTPVSVEEPLLTDSKSEIAEWEIKRKRLGMQAQAT